MVSCGGLLQADGGEELAELGDGDGGTFAALGVVDDEDVAVFDVFDFLEFLCVLWDADGGCQVSDLGVGAADDAEVLEGLVAGEGGAGNGWEVGEGFVGEAAVGDAGHESVVDGVHAGGRFVDEGDEVAKGGFVFAGDGCEVGHGDWEW